MKALSLCHYADAYLPLCNIFYQNICFYRSLFRFQFNFGKNETLSKTSHITGNYNYMSNYMKLQLHVYLVLGERLLTTLPVLFLIENRYDLD